MRLATYATNFIQLGIKGSLILNQNHCPVQCSLERYFQRERDYYSTNLSILNISSYRDLNLFGMLNPANTIKSWRYSNYKSPNFCWLFFSWSPNFNLLSIPYILHPFALDISFLYLIILNFFCYHYY